MGLLEIRGLVETAWLGNPTVYSNGFAENKFRSIKVGMTAAEVAAVLGPPLKREPFGGFPLVWYYSDQKTAVDNFWRRWIAFENGRVSEVISDFWVD